MTIMETKPIRNLASKFFFGGVKNKIDRHRPEVCQISFIGSEINGKEHFSGLC